MSKQDLTDQLVDWEIDLRKNKGSGVAVLAKNFGNLRPNDANPYKAGVYSISAKNEYQTFNSYTEGLKGLIWDVKSKQGLDGLSSKYTDENTTLFEAIDVYAPTKDKNNPKKYAEKIANFVNEKLNTSYTVDTKFSELPTHLVVEAITMVEDVALYNKLKDAEFFGDKIQTLSKEITSKNILKS